jgi:hypothetical protein
MKTIAKISEETLTIINYLQDIPHGQYLTYAQIQKDTKVTMDVRGKSYLRTACKKLKRLYSPLSGENHGLGIRFACKDDAMSHEIKALGTIEHGIKKTKKVTDIITTDFYKEMLPQEQKQVMLVGSLLGAVMVAYKSGQHSIKEVRSTQSLPVLPENIK